MQPDPATCGALLCLVDALRRSPYWPRDGAIRPRQCTLATIHEHAERLDDATLQALEWIVVAAVAQEDPYPAGR